jgi:hypothetical protein
MKAASMPSNTLKDLCPSRVLGDGFRLADLSVDKLAIQ